MLSRERLIQVSMLIAFVALHLREDSGLRVSASLLLLLVCVSFTIIGQPRNSVLNGRV